MAALATYYYSSVSFSTAVALYTDAALSIFAPDGWYSDESIYRQQASGILFASTTCPSCGSPAPPVPTPVTYYYREYTECDGVATQVFRVPSTYVGSWPPTVEYDSKCWENAAVTGSTSEINVLGLTSFLTCVACAPVPPPPINAPEMTTDSSTSVTSVSFTANGSLDTANGTVTSRGFYIGTNSSYLSNTQYPAVGTALGNYSYAFTGATAGTTYYVTAYAVNEHATGVGLPTIETFTPNCL